MKIFISLVAALFVIGCGSKPVDPDMPKLPLPPKVEAPTEPMPNSSFSIPGYQKPWNEKVLTLFDSGLFEKFNVAKSDFKRFCPKYGEMSVDNQKLAWGAFIGAITRYESNFKPATVYKEPDGSLSEGLFQLTYGNKFCPTSKSKGNLHDPLINIDCGLRIMADYISRDGVVAAGGYVKYGAPAPKGAAKYWSVVRVPDKKSKHYLTEIIGMVKKSPGCL